jgi:hypothetical protein
VEVGWLVFVIICSGEWDLSHFKKKDRKDYIENWWAAKTIILFYLVSPTHHDDNQQLINEPT